MPANIIDGAALAAKIDAETLEKAAAMHRPPVLAALLVGNDPASRLYVTLKGKACLRLGLGFRLVELPETDSADNVKKSIQDLNDDAAVDAFIVQLPLPKALRPYTEEILSVMDPAKDADGFHKENLAAFEAGQTRIRPVLAGVVEEMVSSVGFDGVGKKAVVVGNSDVFFRPVAHILRMTGAETSFVSPNATNLADVCREADLLVVAVGRAQIIKGDMIKPGAVIIDIGTNRLNNKTVGDVDFESAKAVAGWLTPVPGGVGPMTVAMLISNAVALAK